MRFVADATSDQSELGRLQGMLDAAAHGAQIAGQTSEDRSNLSGEIDGGPLRVFKPKRIRVLDAALGRVSHLKLALVAEDGPAVRVVGPAAAAGVGAHRAEVAVDERDVKIGQTDALGGILQRLNQFGKLGLELGDLGRHGRGVVDHEDEVQLAIAGRDQRHIWRGASVDRGAGRGIHATIAGSATACGQGHVAAAYCTAGSPGAIRAIRIACAADDSIALRADHAVKYYREIRRNVDDSGIGDRSVRRPASSAGIAIPLGGSIIRNGRVTTREPNQCDRQ